MIIGHVVKLDPTSRQQRELLSHIGAARFSYNTMLAYVNDNYDKGIRVNVSGYSLRKVWNENKDNWAPWWAENAKEAYANAILNLGKAWRNFFNGLKSGRNVGRPRFKRKGVGDSYTVTTGSFGICDRVGIKLPRIGRIHTLEPVGQFLDANIKSVTIRKKADGFYASLAVGVSETPQPVKTGKGVGVDLGVSTLATLSTGEVIANPKALARQERKLRRAARSVSRKKKGSANREKAKATLSRVYQKVTNLRTDTRHKATTDIVSRFDLVAIEDLNVSGMVSNRKLAKSVSDAGFYEFRRCIEYKAKRYGKTVAVVDRWYPSTKTCSCCGHVQNMPLSVRVYSCPECGFVCDRDVNAARNLIHVAGSAPETQNACGETVSRSLVTFIGETPRVSAKQESCVRHLSV